MARTPRSIGPAILLACLACSGNQDSTGEPTVQRLPADSIVLSPGQPVRVEGLRVSFEGVDGDSRCPVDAVCIWQGDAAVRLALAAGAAPGSTFALHTAEGVPSAEYAGYRVTLLALLPAPRTDASISPEDYRASVRVEALD